MKQLAMGHGSGDVQMNQKWPEPLIRAAAEGLIQGMPTSATCEALPVAIYTTDADGRLTFYNEAAAALWGQRPKLGDDRGTPPGCSIGPMARRCRTTNVRWP
jgi:PAS domain-containing protein